MDINVGGGSTQFEVKAIDLNGEDSDDVVLDLDLDNTNSNVTMFVLQNTVDEIEIEGIDDGTEGRRIILVNDTGNVIKFKFDTGTAEDRILNYTSEVQFTDKGGSVELVYTEEVSGSGRWIAYSLVKGQ